MTTQQDSFGERLTRLETEVADVKELLGDSATVQAQMLNVLNQLDRRFDKMDRRFDKMDGRFDGMDRRFDRVDGRIDMMGGRLDRMDGRIEDIATHLGVPRRNGTA